MNLTVLWGQGGLVAPLALSFKDPLDTDPKALPFGFVHGPRAVPWSPIDLSPHIKTTQALQATLSSLLDNCPLDIRGGIKLFDIFIF